MLRHDVGTLGRWCAGTLVRDQHNELAVSVQE